MPHLARLLGDRLVIPGPAARPGSGRPSCLAERHDVADDHHGGRPDPLPGRVGGDVLERRCQYLLAGIVPSMITATGVVAALPRLISSALIGVQVGDGHQQHQRARAVGQRLPVDARARLGRVKVRGDDGEVLGDAAVGDRDPGIGGNRDRAGHARDDLERHTSADACQRLLAAPAEHERVAALEPDHAAAGQRAVARSGR